MGGFEVGHRAIHKSSSFSLSTPWAVVLIVAVALGMVLGSWYSCGFRW
ncbi:hypothetical protein LCGC14_0338170 [marine sediment metagenome]|uniref:Uncharacterized protein n=1 Tax=marine sediment metagenome TaxID=412755 RepID=A0A0F9WLZ8_9ZZZZ